MDVDREYDFISSCMDKLGITRWLNVSDDMISVVCKDMAEGILFRGFFESNYPSDKYRVDLVDQVIQIRKKEELTVTEFVDQRVVA